MDHTAKINPNQSVPTIWYHLIGQECIDPFGKINQLIS